MTTGSIQRLEEKKGEKLKADKEYSEKYCLQEAKIWSNILPLIKNNVMN